ncbi:Fibrinogen-like protein A [Holothuria leucospilota]|uniref:Fibrinogen-like protein A n=1 Tax=Holothuria leucospilota TaxID=206669 RepID=A0A9Q0YN81_HOLLE|nr:Fibrinogen-like protein A [Holothuria leucospilota]
MQVPFSSRNGDALNIHNNEDFSTRDRDNDDSSLHTASNSKNGAWWWGMEDLPAPYSKLNALYGEHLFWTNLPADSSNIQYTEMKVRPVED